MGDTAVLLDKITALRQRLQQAQGLARDADSAATALVQQGGDGLGRLGRLEQQAADVNGHHRLLDDVLRQLSGADSSAPTPGLPHRLTARARRLLEQARDLIGRLRSIGHDLESDLRPGDPLGALYGEVTAAADAALRMVQAFPDSPSAQLRLSEGLEGILGNAARRTAVLDMAVARRRMESQRLDTLVEWLTALHSGHGPDLAIVQQLAEALLADAREQQPVRLPAADVTEPARFAAGHGLAVGQVVARIVEGDAEWRQRPLEPVVAALLHDAGMAGVPSEILSAPGPLDDAGRRAVEAHSYLGATRLARVKGGGSWLTETAGGHHERLDGTGYPGGVRETQIAPLTRLVAVCDVYAALCTARPYRPARESRTALTDTLLLADQGVLDRTQAGRLLTLSFYPVGTAVELADGAVGVVVACPAGRHDLNAPARPVVALLTDSRGRPLPTPYHLDLSRSDHRSIVRSLSTAERQRVLGTAYPEVA